MRANLASLAEVLWYFHLIYPSYLALLLALLSQTYGMHRHACYKYGS